MECGREALPSGIPRSAGDDPLAWQRLFGNSRLPGGGGPNAENSTLINGFYEVHPIVYGEDAYGFARTGQTICNVTDSKVIKLFVDDEPFSLPTARFLAYDRRLNLKEGTLDRTLLWETPAGKQISITSRRMVSLSDKHVAVISFIVTVLNAEASIVISSEMQVSSTGPPHTSDDPRQTRAFAERVLHPQASYARDNRIVLCHATLRSRMILACATDHVLETSCSYTNSVRYGEDFGQVLYNIQARPGCPVTLNKYLIYHSSATSST